VKTLLKDAQIIDISFLIEWGSSEFIEEKHKFLQINESEKKEQFTLI
jgi:hypothetical protein